MSDVVFVDTNILVYAHDRDAGSKREKAARALDRLWDERLGRLSAQVLQEFYVTVTKKHSTSSARASAREVVSMYAPWVQHPTTPDTILRATELAELAEVSFWDALILAAAEQAGASQLYSEDLNSGQTIAGVKIVNPLITE
jgi:predicted nucleic acid-binding protein